MRKALALTFRVLFTLYLLGVVAFLVWFAWWVMTS